MVIYGLALLYLDKAIRAADSGVLQPWYMENAVTWGTARHNTTILCDLMKKNPIMGTFWSQRRADTFLRRGNKRREIEQILMFEGLKVPFTRGQKYLRGLCGGWYKM